MRATLFVLLTVTGCATSYRPPGTPTAFQPVCLPCPMPCAPDSCAPKAAVAAKPAPAPAVAAAPAPAPVAAPAPAPRPASPPAIDPAGRTFERSQEVTLASETPGAVIHYTTDGSAPDASSKVYSGPISVTETTTVRAVAVAPGAPASDEASATYTLAPPPAPPAETPRVVVTKEKFELKEKVFFDTNQATIKPVSFGLLDEVATALKAHDEVKRIRVEGYTDNLGKPDYNLSLSQRRAEAVRAYLVDKGIDAGRIEAKGFGQTNPIEPNTSAKGRDANRRVELRIVE